MLTPLEIENMKKILPVLLGLFALMLVACQPQGSTPTGGEQTPPVTGGEQTPPATETPAITVESVELKMQDAKLKIKGRSRL